MKNLPKNSTFIVIIHTATDSYSNPYFKVVNAFKVKDGERTYFDLSNEQVHSYVGSDQLGCEFMERQGYILLDYLSQMPQLVILTFKVPLKKLKV